ncbi:BhlA/UviB family holin-like peptide [Clostridium sp. JS66]|uniref:BhlA/UviB family holin-like peptide n=1 Tax=Clostridium sp. JS66 TaxID=3064705 RepID=UPI00298E285E|nr:BhlA/UviB family holin-like peptide [Clostridium sp. JS66]WPC42325.1 BhlA/UviB family holin-like peptide [Clostridium sp. JS66]
MESELFKLAASQGIWAALSIVLIFYIVKAQEKRDLNQDEREKNYQNIILKLTNEFEMIENIQKDVVEIKQHINKNASN